MKRDVYKEVTDKIVCDLEEGVRAWVKPWDAEHAAGRITRPLRSNGIPYQGINILMLWMCAMEQDYSAPIWMTFKQARELDGHVRKGEKGSLVVYFNTMTKAGEDANGDEIEHKIPFLRNYSVFNVEQIDGLPEHYYATKADAPKLDPVARNEPLDGFFAATGASIRHGGNRAYYAIGEDRIQMPVFETFREAGSYYATLGHETVHWTRHPSRLARDFGRKRWGDEGYAMEELVAELGSAFLCADLHITPEVREDHAAYIENWLDVLKSDKRAIFHAAAHAQKATDFLHQQQKPEAGRAGPEDKIPLPPPEKSATFFPTAERSGIKEMSELEEFKTAINLTEYAAAQGFEMDRRKTSRNSVFMRHPGGDKIIIARELDGHWVYCSVTDESGGSIIDLVQDLQGGSLGDVRKELRPWIGKGGAVSRPPVKTYAPSVEPTSKDRQAVVREYEQMQPVNRLPYLEQVRGIPATVLSSPRFAGKIS
ncbi:MAG: DUF1738 domain-containing protein, partial [Gammaproteobacteria bacterium]|nr:DUF1738 domain-containing protein [Gammaproteobacteria bacterium]